MKEQYVHVQGYSWTNVNYITLCVFVVGFEDECIVDPVLWPPQCICTYIRMDPVPQSSGGLRYWRGSAIVSVTQI